MATSPSRPKPPVNPVHRSQVTWQIVVPMALFGAIILGAGIWLAVTASGHVSQTSALASTSLIFILAPIILAGGITFLVVIAGIYLLAKALNIIPFYTRIAQLYIQRLGINIHLLADRLAAPVMVGRSRFAGWKKFWQQIRSLVKFKKEN